MEPSNSELPSELRDRDVAHHYELIAGTFLDTRGAAASLMAQISKDSRIFEIGMGTGYFARHLVSEGYQLDGIEPPGVMLEILQEQILPRIDIEEKQQKFLEEYEFDGEKYDVIVSHSSVFLFTDIGGEVVFQSMIVNRNLRRAIAETRMRGDALTPGTLEVVREAIKKDRARTVVNLEKVMDALNDGGRFFINIQPNLKIRAAVEHHLTWEMPKWQYDFYHGWVLKEFVFTHRGRNIPLDPDVSYVWSYTDFKQFIEELGYQDHIPDDRKWVVLTRATSP